MNPDEKEILIRLDTNVANLHRELLGAAGQIGRIPKIEERQEAHAKQINFWRGAIAIIGLLVVLVGSAFAAHVLGGR